MTVKFTLNGSKVEARDGEAALKDVLDVAGGGGVAAPRRPRALPP